MKYVLLNNISGAAVLLVVTLIFSMLFEPRYPLKKYLASLIPFLAILFGVNFYVIFKYGFPNYAKLTLLIATLPSLIYFFITSRDRDGRFFFTFCLVDTSSIWFALLVGILDVAFGMEGILNFILRLTLAPVFLYLVFRWGRRPYLGILHTVKRGWWLFTFMTGIVYVLLIVLVSVPTPIRERPESMPLAILITIFLPLVYAAIFWALYSQQKLYDMGTLEHIFAAQSVMMETRADEIHSAEEKVRIARHDLRHQLNIIQELTLKGNQEEVLNYLGSAQKSLDTSTVAHYCANPILDAILSSYFRRAEELHISVEKHLSIPDELPVLPAELATVFANALENAIHANMNLPVEQRKLQCTCLSHPRLMFEIKNPYIGTVEFDSQGLPITRVEHHGIGSRSIAAFCKKYSASYVYSAKDGWFSLMVQL